MAIEIPVDDIDTDKIGGFDRVAKGWAHVEIVHVDEDGGDKGEMIVDFEVLRHSVDNQQGKVHREYFSKVLNKELPRRKFFALAIATSLTTAVELNELKKQGKSPVLDYNQCQGKQVVIELEDNEYQGRISTKLAFDRIFHPTDKKAADCPLHAGKLTAANIKLPEGRNIDGAVAAAGGNGKKKPPQTATGANGATPNGSQSQASNVDELMAGMD